MTQTEKKSFQQNERKTEYCLLCGISLQTTTKPVKREIQPPEKSSQYAARCYQWHYRKAKQMFEVVYTI